MWRSIIRTEQKSRKRVLVRYFNNNSRRYTVLRAEPYWWRYFVRHLHRPSLLDPEAYERKNTLKTTMPLITNGTAIPTLIPQRNRHPRLCPRFNPPQFAHCAVRWEHSPLASGHKGSRQRWSWQPGQSIREHADETALGAPMPTSQE